MKPYRAVAFGVFSLLGLAAPAQAGWQSAFQVTCFNHSSPAVSHYGPAPAVSHYGAAPAVSHYGAADPCNPCPPQPPTQVCTTKYVQRCFYQPVTSYQTKTYYEPVTTYKTSYYYEPVTTYRTSYYFDPCTCCYRQVCTPCTSYKLRSQCCPVQSYVQRCCSVPVTTYKQCCYWEPQTCCTTVDPCAAPNGTAASQPPAAGYTPPAAAPAVPAVTEQHNYSPPPAAPMIQEYRNGSSGSRLYDQFNPPAVPARPNSFDSNTNFYRYPAAPYTPHPSARPAPPVARKPNFITRGNDAPNARLIGIQLAQDGR